MSSNPFFIRGNSKRKEVVKKYRNLFLTNPKLMLGLDELKRKYLVASVISVYQTCRQKLINQHTSTNKLVMVQSERAKKNECIKFI